MRFRGWIECGGINQLFDNSQTRQTPLFIIGKLVFWLVFIIAINMAVEVLGITQISPILASSIAYVPQVIAAVLILLGAVVLAAALAFGLGGREVAGQIVQRAYGRGEQAVQQTGSSASDGGSSVRRL